jgi:hypothetical protein
MMRLVQSSHPTTRPFTSRCTTCQADVQVGSASRHSKLTQQGQHGTQATACLAAAAASNGAAPNGMSGDEAIVTLYSHCAASIGLVPLDLLLCLAVSEPRQAAHSVAEAQQPDIARRQLLLSAAAALSASPLWGGRVQPAEAANVAAGAPQPLRGDMKAAVDQALAKAMDKAKV